MICEKIDLYQHYGIERNGANGGYLYTYSRMLSSELKPHLRPAMVVLPGGGYEFLSDREGEPVALAYLNKGYSAFVLKYSIFAAHPVPLIEACMAVAFVRENAEKYNVDVNHVAAIGFSAGGHLCGTLATLCESSEVVSALGDHAAHCKPDAVVLSYPVVTMRDGLTHEGTRYEICAHGEIAYDSLSVEKLVTSQSVPAFIWHTMEDNCVPVENSLLLANAYKQAGVPFALHIFEKGWHGLSLVNAETSDENPADLQLRHVGKWLELSLDWLLARGFRVLVK